MNKKKNMYVLFYKNPYIPLHIDSFAYKKYGENISTCSGIDLNLIETWDGHECIYYYNKSLCREKRRNLKLYYSRIRYVDRLKSFLDMMEKDIKEQ